MREHDDFVHAFGCERVHFSLHGFGWIFEDHVVAGAGKFIRVLRCQTDEADFLTATLDDGGFREFTCKKRFARHVSVRHQDRKVDRVHEAREDLWAVVEFVVADGHAVIAKLVHELGGHCTLIVGIEQRALELVAAIHEDGVVGPRAGLGHGGDQTCGAAKAFASSIVLGRAAAVVFANRFKTRVEIVGVQDGQRIIRRRRRSCKRQCAG